MKNAEWYVDWFNSPYYHLLYKNRDRREANFFIDNLCRELQLKQGAKIWDLACGKGRHSIALNQKGFDVTGTDLSNNSILAAKKSENELLHFEVHDMRTAYKENYFDAVFNLFTSIGYFPDERDNEKVFRYVSKALKKNGEFVIDFFNAEKVLNSFKAEYHELKEGIQFDITKRIQNNAILKRIEFSDQGHDYYFEEFVSLLKKEDFIKLGEQCGLTVHYCFGNYQLEPFDVEHSDRLIMIFKK